MGDFIVSGPSGDPLSPFSEMGKSVPWDKRLKLIKEQFPVIDHLDWQKAFSEDPHIMGKIFGDILKMESAPKGKPGKRPSLNQKEGMEAFRKLVGEDYSEYEFTEAFNALCGDRSVRAVAHKTGLDRNLVYKLKRGGDPTAYAMEQIAKAFGKDPTFFAEYRLLYILGFLSARLEANPESTIALVKRLKVT